MSKAEDPGRLMKLDESAPSADASLPAFLSPPADAPVYHGFPIVAESETGGWLYGAITEYADPNGCDSGDGYVVAPDGSRAGLVWNVGEHEIQTVCAPDKSRWGVYEVWFPNPVRTTSDMVSNFRFILPELKKKYIEISSRHDS